MRRWDRLQDSYMQEYQARGVSQETVAATESRLSRWGLWLKKLRPRISIEQIDAQTIGFYMAGCASFRSKATVYGTLSTMRGFGDFLVRQGLWNINPLRWMKGPKVTPYTRLPRRIDRAHMEAMWSVAARRSGEFNAHLWVTVLALLYGTRPRAIPIPEPVYTELLAYLIDHGKRGALFRTVAKRSRLSLKDVCEIVRNIARRAGLPDYITPRTLRHSFATHLMDRGVDLAIIASLMGHRSPQETGVYLHVLPGRPQAAVSKLPLGGRS